ncbi:MAG: AAA family ATPase, partial [Spirochaetales bacterium]|nr:AAA family ATPase [Spirochaetales bacterium]
VLENIHADTRVILVGDTHQLPSVQAGNLLEDIINAGKFNVCYLRDITLCWCVLRGWDRARCREPILH